MAQLASAVRVRPLARAAAHHTAADRWLSLLTGHLPRPLARRLRHAGRQRLRGKRRSALGLLGRGDPYGGKPGAPPGAVLALMASVVVPALRRREMALLRLAAQLPTRALAARPGPEPVPPVAAATDRERALAATTVPRMKDRYLIRRHRSLQSRRPGHPLSVCARLYLPAWCCLAPRTGGGIPPQDPGAYRGRFLFAGSRKNTPPPPDPLHPPRYARDDDADLRVQISTDFGERLQHVAIRAQLSGLQFATN